MNVVPCQSLKKFTCFKILEHLATEFGPSRGRFQVRVQLLKEPIKTSSAAGNTLKAVHDIVVHLCIFIMRRRVKNY